MYKKNNQYLILGPHASVGAATFFTLNSFSKSSLRIFLKEALQSIIKLIIN